MRDNRRLSSILVVAMFVLLCLPFFDMVYLYPAATRLVGDRLIEETRNLGDYLVRQLGADEGAWSHSQLVAFKESFALQEISIRNLDGELTLSSNPHAVLRDSHISAPFLRRGTPFSQYLIFPDDHEGRHVLELQIPWSPPDADHVLILRRDVTTIKTGLEALVSRSAVILFAIAIIVIVLVVLTIRMARQAVGQLQHSEQLLLDNRVQLKQKHAELELLFSRVEQAKREWQLALDCISDMVLIVDEQGKIRRCNEAVIRFLGRSYLNVLGKDWQRLILPDGAPMINLNQQNAQVYHGDRNIWLALQLYPYQSGEQQHLTVIKIVPQQQGED